MHPNVVFENAHFIVVDKPAGTLTIPSRDQEKDERPCLLTLLKNKYPQILVVHRLDYEVSGLVLFALTADAHREANKWFESRVVHKKYEALTEGDSSVIKPGREFYWECKLLRGKKRAYESGMGKESRTRARVLAQVEFQGQSMIKWELNPLTGRSHQLRFELFRHGFPICGDELYGSKTVFAEKPDTIALRAVELDFRECGSKREEFELPEVISVGGLGV